MRYQTRNIIILTIFSAIILIFGGYMSLWAYPRATAEMQGELTQINQRIEQLAGVESQFTVVRDEIEQKKNLLSSLSKEITNQVTAAASYNFINQIMGYSGEFDLNMLYVGDTPRKGFGFHTYRLQGEGSFYNLYRFIAYLERGPKLMAIHRLNLRSIEQRDEETNEFSLLMPFDLELRAYYAQAEDLPENRRSLADTRVPKAANPFYPYIYQDVPPNTEGLLDSERATLHAVLPERALVVDANGKVTVLKVGDPVYLGYLTLIRPESNEIEFTLNKGGIVEKLVLSVNFGTSKE